MMIIQVEYALRLCAERGLSCAIVHRSVAPNRQLLLSLTTTDSDPMLTLLEGQRERLIDARQQSGPERWDYTLTVEESASEIGLRVHLGSRSELVPFLPVGVAYVSAFGWRDGYEADFPVLLDREQLESAISKLSTGEPAQ